MRHDVLSVVLICFFLGCGPDADDIVNRENKTLSDMSASENVMIEEALNRIRLESDMIAKGGTVEMISPTVDLQPDTTISVALVTEIDSTDGSYLHHIQLGAFTTEAAAARSASLWEANGFTNVTFLENPNATTIYRYVVRLTGYSGYRAALSESERINRQFNIKSFPLQITR